MKALLAALGAAAALAVAAAPAPAAEFTPAQGSYAGEDRSQRPVHFAFHDGFVERWRLDNRIDVGRAYVSTANQHFSVHQGHHELSGHWTDAHHVMGVYAYYRRTSRGLVHVTIHWTAALR